MNKATAALAVPILIGFLKENKGSKSSKLSTQYDQILKRNQNLIKKHKNMVTKYDVVLEFRIYDDQDEEKLSMDNIDLESSFQSIKENYDKDPSNNFDWDYEEWDSFDDDDITSLLKLMNMGVILDFTVHSDKTWNDTIITKKQVIKMFEKARSGTLSDQEKGYFLYEIAEPFCRSKHESDLIETAEYSYDISDLPPNLTEAGNYSYEEAEEPEWFIPDRFDVKAYEVYDEYGVIDALVKDFFNKLRIAENQYKEECAQYQEDFNRWLDDADALIPDPGFDPRFEFWNYLYEDAVLVAFFKFYSMSPNIQPDTEIALLINNVFQSLLSAYGRLDIVRITKKHKGTRLRRR
tara:strand:+ start:504 stop:1553 length:1050 start_codon:yes stop_codon:yes gene_type:complete